MKLESKLPQIGTTIFTVMSRLATEHNAINLGQGFPDFNPDPVLLKHVTQAMADGHNQYPPMAGIKPLRQEIAAKISTLYGHVYDPENEITVTSGATEALMATIMALVKSGDEVIVIEPFYDAYIPAIKLAGGTPVVVAMVPPGPDRPIYQIDWDGIRKAINKRTRLLMINSPHNPTGIVLQSADLDHLERIVGETGILLIADEAYEHIVFDGQLHQSLARREALAAHAIVIGSFGKTYHATGWKVGYCCAPKTITTEIRKIHQFIVFTVNTPTQVALAHYMKDPETYTHLSAFYQKKRDRLYAGLKATRFRPLSSQGTFFLLADYQAISSLPEAEFARWLTTEHGVGVIPVSAFYEHPGAKESNHHLARFCFAKEDQTLDTAIARLLEL